MLQDIFKLFKFVLYPCLCSIAISKMMNCIIVDDDKLVRSFMEMLVKRTPTLNLVGVCSSASEALKVLVKEQVELILLDIDMPGMSGIQLLNYFNRDQIQIIFITSSEEHAVKAFDLEATDYLVKPVSEERFLKAIMRTQKRKKSSEELQQSEDLFVKVNNRLVRIGMNNILYIEGLANHVSINTKDGKRHIVLSTLKSIESRLSQDKFMRIHNSHIVSIDKISAIEDNVVIIEKIALPVSRSHKKELLAKLKTV
jgi:two-component system LytT family response regulator